MAHVALLACIGGLAFVVCAFGDFLLWVLPAYASLTISSLCNYTPGGAHADGAGTCAGHIPWGSVINLKEQKCPWCGVHTLCVIQPPRTLYQLTTAERAGITSGGMLRKRAQRHQQLHYSEPFLVLSNVTAPTLAVRYSGRACCI